MTPSTGWSIVRGGVAGILIFAGIAVAQSLITGLAVGVIVKPWGDPRFISPVAGWWVGLALAVVAALLALARELWWAPVAARVTAVIVTLLLAGVGVAFFFPEYFRSIGTDTLPPLVELLISGSQSTAVYVFAGAGLATAFLDARRRARRAAGPDPKGAD